MNIHRRNKANPEFSLAAMVDVILLMLIFFMLTSTAANQSTIDVQLPKAEATEATPSADLTVSIKPDGSFFVNDIPTARQEVEKQLVSLLDRNQKKAFTIRADENTLHKDVVFIMEIAEKHKYNIAIATVKD
ncbi:biopolymer transporter ExbD [Elizabethkingia sp. JS20170427COW]|uniref:ExbD/TolR family protein n=1 Tax=Elizabethkingia sp. JS20170427COW TaxID=2583851 RepID=UPI00111002A4|nr:biopolymer transporter ExbD [Elizabethkingia sp. JS20170427COW]QCX52999.1 biopolymer transporter ExbD [Elizabethkingia sp. JS20170427COW]